MLTGPALYLRVADQQVEWPPGSQNIRRPFINVHGKLDNNKVNDVWRRLRGNHPWIASSVRPQPATVSPCVAYDWAKERPRSFVAPAMTTLTRDVGARISGMCGAVQAPGPATEGDAVSG